MGSIYLNKEDKEILTCIKKQLNNADEIDFINKLLEQEKQNRLHHNKVANIYKKTKRAENKDFARSKKEIDARIKCNS